MVTKALFFYIMYRPKINKNTYNTIGRYSKFIKQFVDINDWGYLKKHRYSWPEMENNIFKLNENDNSKHQLKSTINYQYTYTKDKPFGTGKNRIFINSLNDIKEIDKRSYDYLYYKDLWDKDGKITMHKQRDLCLESHLLASKDNNKKEYLFYTNNYTKDYNIICCDIDDIESDESYYDTIEFLSSIFPNCYYERSTNGSGLHFYIIISFSPARYLFSDVNESVYRNIIYYLLSSVLSVHINNKFSVKFDEVKGTCPVYDNNDFIKFGTLVKLPAPVTYEDFNTLYSSSVYSSEYMFCVINYFNDISCKYLSGVYNTFSLISSLSLVLKNTTLKTSPKELISSLSTCTTLSSPTSNCIGGTNVSKKVYSIEKNNCKVSSNNDLEKKRIVDIINIGDSRIRESLYIKEHVRNYYNIHKILPTLEQVENSYRIEMNYNKFGEKRSIRFKEYYKHTIETFNIKKAVKRIDYVDYKVGMYYSSFTQTNEQITEWTNENTSYKRKIYRYDIDITLEYIRICSRNTNSKARSVLIKRYAKQECITELQADKELKNTLPRKGLMNFFKYIKNNHKTTIINGKVKNINLCDRKKATALLNYIEHIGLAECTDNTFNQGKARKYVLTLTTI